MKTLTPFSLVLVASLGLGSVAIGHGSNPPPSSPKTSQVIPEAPVGHRVASNKDARSSSHKVDGSSDCLRDTGSLIKPKKGHCLPVPGHSYSREDLQRTGQPDTGRALQMLDPSITSHGH